MFQGFQSKRKTRVHNRSDVIIMGGGLAGVSAALLLRRRSYRVICIGPTPEPDYSLGESLDFAAPALFAELGFDGNALVCEDSATWKKLIKVETFSGESFVLRPLEFFESVFRTETRTIHVDRSKFDAALREAAQAAGVEFVDAKVTRLKSDSDAINACVTPYGEYSAGWYLDATSRTRLAARHFEISCRQYGAPKVAIWAQIEAVPELEGTTLRMDNRLPYLEWLWEIPVTAQRASIGLVLSSERLKAVRQQSESTQALLARKMREVERFRGFRESDFMTPVRACAFQNSVIERPYGSNWLAIGEAAAMVDPLTSSGASAAIRHARMADVVVDQALSQSGVNRDMLEKYNQCVQMLGGAFNCNIEKTVYEPLLRNGISLFWAAFAYTIFGYFFNAIVQRLDFQSDRDLRRMRLAERSFGAWLGLWQLLGRAKTALRQPHASLRWE